MAVSDLVFCCGWVHEVSLGFSAKPVEGFKVRVDWGVWRYTVYLGVGVDIQQRGGELPIWQLCERE